MNGNKLSLVRDLNVLSNETDLEPVLKFPNFPVFMGCVSTPIEDDLFLDMNWKISKTTGIVQIDPIVDSRVVYMMAHGSGTVGNIWKNHHIQFANYVRLRMTDHILEIGSSHGILYDNLADNNLKMTFVEPNYSGTRNDNITVIDDFFSISTKLPHKYDTVVHSHLFEHIFDYDEFLTAVGRAMNIGGKMIFSVPNLEYILSINQLHLNFEHTVLLTDVYIQYLLKKYGFAVEDKHDYLNHSIFYSAAYTGVKQQSSLDFDALYTQNKKLIEDTYRRKKEDVEQINEAMKNVDGKIYLYSGHIFSQFMINLGLNVDLIECVLDNDPIKHGKRLYGTKLKVVSPANIDIEITPHVIVRTGVYDEEIKNQLYKINNSVCFL